MGLRLDEEIPSVMSALKNDGMESFTGIPCSTLVVMDFILPSSLTPEESEAVGELTALKRLATGEALCWGVLGGAGREL